MAVNSFRETLSGQSIFEESFTKNGINMQKNFLFNLRRNAMIVGGSLFGLYYLVTEAINRLAIPGVPLAEPSGGIFLQFILYAIIGALLGLICTLPATSMIGAVLGGAVGASCILLFNIIGVMNSQSIMGGMALITIIAILPTTLLLTPVSWAVRYAAEALTPDDVRETSRLNWKRVALVALAFIFIGTTALYPSYVRDSLVRTNLWVQNSLTQEKVAPPLQSVANFPQDAQGSYQIEWSDHWQDFMGSYSASLDQLTAFLIRVKFENGFTIYCIASATTQPVCLNENSPSGN